MWDTNAKRLPDTLLTLGGPESCRCEPVAGQTSEWLVIQELSGGQGTLGTGRGISDKVTRRNPLTRTTNYGD